MHRIVIATAGFICAWSGAAGASETMGGPGIGTRSSTTAAVHCDAMTGPERTSCMRALHERDKVGGADPAARARGTREATHPPVKAAPAQSRTAVEATARAADPKAPSGALIIDTPSGKLPKP